MSVATRKPSRRYSQEQQQENRSRTQFEERLSAPEIGWIPSKVDTDMGEDLLVRIYDGGRSTGLSFYVQLKSTADSASLKLKRKSALAYALEVKDLLHWEVSTTLVVLVVWDVEKRTGWWRPIQEIIKELDKANGAWRKKKNVSVSVPLANSTDGDGLTRLRWEIAKYNSPLIPKPDMSVFKLSFPSTNGGRKGFETLRQAVDTGESVVLDGELVPIIEWPEWHVRAYGAAYHQPISIQFNSKQSDASVAVRIEAESPEGTAAFPYVELRCERCGKMRLVLANDHQNLPLTFTLESTEEGDSFHFKQARLGSSVYEAQEAANFTLIAMAKGSTVRVIDLATGQAILTVTPDHEPTVESVQQARQWYDLLDKLCFIQRRIATQGTLSLEAGILLEDIEATERIFKILRSGRSEGKLSLSGTLGPVRTTRVRQVISTESILSIAVESPPTRILGVDVRLGKVRMVPVDNAAFLSEYEARQAEANRTHSMVQFRVQDLPVIEEYVEWMPDDLRWERLSKMAARQEGYCTLSQARWVGYADEVFLALIPAGKVHARAVDVFHLAQFPRSDYEEHIVLWLQTDREGVLSHETALLLHELSDILPGRLHVTVPIGFDAGSRRFDANVELRYGAVTQDEKCWQGPVPYTSALRTLNDCIEVGVSPDLMEQAIEEGLERGMFTKDQIPTSVWPKSA